MSTLTITRIPQFLDPWFTEIEHIWDELEGAVNDIETRVVTLEGSIAGITALTGDVTATGPGIVPSTIQPNVITNSKIRQSVALSILGNSTNATANIADITAGTDGFVLRRSGTSLAFGLLSNTNIATGAAIDFSKLASLTSGNILVGSAGNVATSVAITGDITIDNTGLTAFRNGSPLSVLGVDTNASVPLADIIAGSDGDVLQRSGTTLIFGPLSDINIDSGAAIDVTKLAPLGFDFAVITNASGFLTTSPVTSLELSYLGGATSNIQAQINAIVGGGGGNVIGPVSSTNLAIAIYNGTSGTSIQNSAVTITGTNTLNAVGTILSSLTANRALASDGSKNIVASSVTLTELNFVSGATSNIQAQINAITGGTGDVVGPGSATDLAICIFNGTTGKLIQNSAVTVTATNKLNAAAINISGLTASTALVTDASKNIISSSVTSSELGFVSGVTSSIQTQLNAKLSTTLTTAQIFIGNGSNIATGVIPSGGFTIDANGFSLLGAQYNFTKIITSGGTSTAVAGSANLWSFTGSTTHTLVLPVTTTILNGWKLRVINNSTGAITVNSSGANLVYTVSPSTDVEFIYNGTVATDATSWFLGFTDARITSRLLTGYSSGAGTVAATDTILQAIQKLNGNDALNVKIAQADNFRLMATNGSANVTEVAAITASRALVSDSNGIPIASAVTATELGFVAGVTSNIQTQINAIVSGGGTFTSAVNFDRTATAVSTNSANQTIIGVTSTAAARTITLLTADMVNGRVMIIKDESGGAGTNNITIATQGAETIDGVNSIDIVVNYGVIRVYSDGSNWFTF